jgi:NADPH:quinone reductase-like Zn-dependent oxidoreductase
LAIQLAKYAGATVATTTSAANADLVSSLGADVAVDCRKEDFAHVLRDYYVVLNGLDKVKRGTSDDRGDLLRRKPGASVKTKGLIVGLASAELNSPHIEHLITNVRRPHRGRSG